jgi:regulator of sigma E protease
MNTTLAVQLLTFIIGIAILIVLHEIGHFVAARALKVEVEEFGLGFPPRVARLFHAWGTDFTLNAIPLGGFVRPKGENDPTVEGGLAASSPWVRLVVLVAGPAMNLLIGVIIGAILFYNIGKPITNKVLIDLVAENSPAAGAGLRHGDLIIEVNGTKIDSQQKLQEITSQNLNTPITLVYQRGDQVYTVSLTPRLNPPQGQGPIGIGMTNPTEPITISQALTTGVSVTFDNIRQILTLPVRAVQGQTAPQEGRLVGYKGMFTIYQQIINPLWFFMAISISLGVINLLPFPSLDGGRILMTLPEILFHRRIPTRFENAINLVGFAFLIILLIYVNVQDFINPIQLPK